MSTPRDNAPISSLPDRPRATTFRIEDLLLDVRRGRVRVPAFQRPFKWERADAWSLLESILLGYPIGTLLLWRGSGNSKALRPALHDFMNSDVTDEDAVWVIDGQQRIVSLARMLLTRTTVRDTGFSGKDSFAAFIDLDEPPQPKTVSQSLVERDRARYLPVDRLANSESLLEWAFDVQLSGPRRERAFQLGRRLREYEVPAYVLDTADEAVLRQVFKRTNATGKQMKEHEVFDALHGNLVPGGGASLEDVATQLTDLGFGEVPPQVLLVLTAVLRGHDIGDLGGMVIPADELGPTYARTHEASQRAIEFLRSDARIPHIRLLPYSHLFIVIARFLDRFPDAPHLVRRSVAMALWRGLASDKASPDISTIRTLIKILADESSPSAASVAERLLGQLGAPSPFALPPMQPPYSFRAARGKLRALAMWSLEPRDLQSGQRLRAEDVLGEEGSLAHLTRESTGTASLTSGNRLFHPSRTGLVKLIREASDEIRASHALPEGELPADHDVDGWSGMLERREQTLAEVESALVSRMAAWDERPRPPISELISDEEAQ